MQTEKRITTKVASDILGVSTTTLRLGLCGTHVVRRVKPGRRILYYESDVLRLRALQDEAATVPLEAVAEKPGDAGRRAGIECARRLAITGTAAKKRQPKAA